MGCSKTICTRDPNSELVFCTFFVNNKRQKYLDAEEPKDVKTAGITKFSPDPSLKLGADSILAADAELLSLVYCNVRYMHGRARCLGWWLLKNRRLKRKQKQQKKGFWSPKEWHQLQHSRQSVDTEDGTNILITKRKYSVKTFKSQQETTSHIY